MHFTNGLIVKSRYATFGASSVQSVERFRWEVLCSFSAGVQVSPQTEYLTSNSWNVVGGIVCSSVGAQVTYTRTSSVFNLWKRGRCDTLLCVVEPLPFEFTRNYQCRFASSCTKHIERFQYVETWSVPVIVSDGQASVFWTLVEQYIVQVLVNIEFKVVCFKCRWASSLYTYIERFQSVETRSVRYLFACDRSSVVRIRKKCFQCKEASSLLKAYRTF